MIAETVSSEKIDPRDASQGLFQCDIERLYYGDFAAVRDTQLTIDEGKSRRLSDHRVAAKAPYSDASIA